MKDFNYPSYVGENDEKKKIGFDFGFLFNILLVFVMILAIISRIFFFSPVTVSGNSMYGTIQDGDYLIFLNTQDVKKQDIVSFVSPLNPEDKFVKRVIATAGDTVEYVDDKLYVNGEFVPEPYLEENKKMIANNSDSQLTENFTLETLPETKTKVVPEGKIFVMGDNRKNSTDGRYFGFVDLDNVLGKYLIEPLAFMES